MERPGKTVTDIAALLFCLLAALAAGWLALRYLLPIALPFLIAWGVALVVRSPARHLCRHTRISPRIMRLALAVAIIAALAGGLWLIGARLARELTDLLSTLTSAGAGDPLRGLFAAIPKLAESELGTWLSGALRSAVGSITAHLPTLLSRMVSLVPRILIALAVTLCACAYFCLDLERIHAACIALIPLPARRFCAGARRAVSRVGGMYLRSYLTLMGITFAEMLVGLSLLRVGYALLLAVLIALVDFLPVLGVGTVLIPWSLAAFVTGDPARGVGLLVLWGVSLAVRQFVEPRLIGRGLGLHPCLTLVAMYAGLRLFGIAGMLLCPPLAALLSAWLPSRAPAGAGAPGDGASPTTDTAPAAPTTASDPVGGMTPDAASPTASAARGKIALRQAKKEPPRDGRMNG